VQFSNAKLHPKLSMEFKTGSNFGMLSDSRGGMEWTGVFFIEMP